MAIVETDLSEDGVFSSKYIQNLISKSNGSDEAHQGSVPKVIVQFWHDKDAIPEDVQECLESWQCLRKDGFERIVFDDEKARKFISDALGARHVSAFDACYHPCMRCDYFRLCYIFCEGGFYCDADEVYQGTDLNGLFSDDFLKLQPLCIDTRSGMLIKANVFMTGQEPSPDWIFYIASAPIIGPAKHPIVQLALERTTRLILADPKKRHDIHWTTGPGNMTASVVKYGVTHGIETPTDFRILPNWESISVSPWRLSYRNDWRNWRFANSPNLSIDVPKK